MNWARIQSRVLFGGECQLMNIKDENKLNAWERRTGEKHFEGIKISDNEIEQMYEKFKPRENLSSDKPSHHSKNISTTR